MYLTCPRDRHAKWRHVVRLAMCVFLLASLASCAVGCGDRHEVYKKNMSRNVGSTIDKPRFSGSAAPQALVASRRLSNGNIENEYRYFIPGCRTFFEFDPKTRIIVNWRFEGRKEDCILP